MPFSAFQPSAITVAGLLLLGCGAHAFAQSREPGASLPVAQADTAASPAQSTQSSDPTQSRNAARSRMRECGHQWSAMKKNGSAAGTTWKDFSQGCLAKQ